MLPTLHLHLFSPPLCFSKAFFDLWKPSQTQQIIHSIGPCFTSSKAMADTSSFQGPHSDFGGVHGDMCGRRYGGLEVQCSLFYSKRSWDLGILDFTWYENLKKIRSFFRCYCVWLNEFQLQGYKLNINLLSFSNYTFWILKNKKTVQFDESTSLPEYHSKDQVVIEM